MRASRVEWDLAAITLASDVLRHIWSLCLCPVLSPVNDGASDTAQCVSPWRIAGG